MIRWLVVIFLALLIFSRFWPFLSKWGLGRLPGDLRFRFAGRDWLLPFASSVVLSLVAMLIVRIL